MVENSLTRFFTSDLTKHFFGDFDFDFLKNCTYTLMGIAPHYTLVDKNGKYSVSVDYDEKRDKINIATDDYKLIITVSEDHDKTNAISSCSYYGRFIMTLPEDCDIDSMEREVDEKNKTMTISFKKIKEEETDELSGTDNKDDECTNDYESMYYSLLKKYESLLKETDTIMAERDALKNKLQKIKENL